MTVTKKNRRNNNIEWFCSSFADDFICLFCERKHKHLHIQWTEDGNILELSSSTSERGCEFLDKFREGVIYDLTGKNLKFSLLILYSQFKTILKASWVSL